MAYSTIASALGVEDEPVQSPPPSAAADTRPMRSGSLISGIASDWRSLSQSEQQAWATLSEARASRSRGTHNIRILSILAWEANTVGLFSIQPLF
ncbi:hypothetical protein BN14_10048 [Rhizoctonia solani AG-1 IB]|nr:hypothetical protein BN14_10048 [Rhizoctonia solani AG-1 IB]